MKQALALFLLLSATAAFAGPNGGSVFNGGSILVTNGGFAPAPVPALDEWGVVGLAAVLAVIALRLLRKK